MDDLADRLYERLLVLRCQAGDEAAFAELVERYQPRLRYDLRKMLGDGPGAEEVLQDVWFDVFKSVYRLADPGAFAAWLYRIARDRAWRSLRQRRPPHRPLREAELVADDPDDGTDFTLEDVARIHAALDRLAPEHREVLVLRFLEEMTYDDIARVTGCQLGTVKSRIYYAKRALRRALERMSALNETDRVGLRAEAPPGIEPGNGGFAIRCLTAWLRGRERRRVRW